jgi:sugar lactone lactonase YvrE
MQAADEKVMMNEIFFGVTSMQLVKRLNTMSSVGLAALAATVFSLAVPVTAMAQVPAVGFTYQSNLGGVGSTPGAQDYNGTISHVAANTRGDSFYDVAACTGSGCATINNTYLGMLPAGSTSSTAVVSLITGMTSGYGGHSAYVDSSNNVWVSDVGDAQILFVPFVNGTYPASIAHSAMTNCSAFPVPANTTTACIVPLNYPNSVGNYIQAADVALDGAGNLYLLSKYIGGSPATQYNMIVQFNTSNVGNILVTGLSNQVSAEFAVDKYGDIYYEDGTNVTYYAAGSSTGVSLGTFTGPSGISIDNGGNVYLTVTGAIIEFPNIAGTVSATNKFTLASNFNCNYSGGLSQGVGIDGAGNLYYGSSYPNGTCKLFVGYYNAGTINQYYVNSGNEFDMNFHTAATLGSFTIAGAGAANFQVNSTTATSGTPSTCTAGSYAAGSSCKLYVNYAEVAVTGPESAVIEALDGSGNLLGSGVMSDYGSQSALNIDPGTTTAIGSGWSAPSAIASDGQTKVYIADAGTGKVYQSVSGATPTVVASGLSAPSAVAVDGAGNLFVADTGEVVEYPYFGGTFGSKVQIVSGLSGTSGLAITSSGILYIADSGNGRVLQVSQLFRNGSSTVGGLVGTVAGTFSIPVAVAVDNLGNLFVSDFGAKKLYKIVLATSTQTTLLSGLVNPAGVAVDEGGSVFLADSSALTITRIPSIAGVLTVGSATTLASPVASPQAIATDRAGNLYVTDPSNMMVAEDNRNIGYLNFGNVVAGSTSAPLSATFTNAGASGSTLNFYYQGPLTGSSTNNFTENTASSCYNAGSPNSKTLSPGASCLYTVTYAPPTATGYQNWGVNLSSGSSNNNIISPTGQSLSVNGTGVSSSAVSITGATSTPYGSAATYTVTNGATTGGPYTVTFTGSALTTTVTLTNGTGTFNLPALGVGSYTASVTIATVPGTLGITVTPASLTVTASSFSRQFDVANPTLTCTYSGFKNGDTSSVVSGSCGISTLATRVSPAAIYQIIPTAGTATAANYTVNTFVDGTLTVTGSVPQTIFFSPLPNFTHGATTYQLTGMSSSGLPLSYTVTAGTASISGSTLTVTGAGAVTITASQAGNSTYAAATSVARSFTAQ